MTRSERSWRADVLCTPKSVSQSVQISIDRQCWKYYYILWFFNRLRRYISFVLTYLLISSIILLLLLLLLLAAAAAAVVVEYIYTGWMVITYIQASTWCRWWLWHHCRLSWRSSSSAVTTVANCRDERRSGLAASFSALCRNFCECRTTRNNSHPSYDWSTSFLDVFST